MANIKSAIKRAELNVKQKRKRTQLKNQLCVLLSKLSKQTHLKNFFRAASSAIDKAETKGLFTKTKQAATKLVFQLNLLNKKQSIEAVFLSSNRKR